MPHTLVTGANSFVAAHVINELIASGHTVTGCVRRVTAGEALLKLHPEWKDELDIIIVEDYAKEGVFDEIFKSRAVDHVVHVATPIPTASAPDLDLDWIEPSVNGVLSILRSTAKLAPTVKSIAITGSIQSVSSGMPEEIAAKTFTNASWNSVTPEIARAANMMMVSYASSKKEAELAVWDFVETTKPGFTVTILLPCLILGPPIQPIANLESINMSVGLVYSMFNGTYEEVPNTHTFLYPSYIDVRDVARAHVCALTKPAAVNKRFLIGGMPLTATLIVETLRRLAEKPVSKGGIPELKGRIPVDTGKDAGALTVKLDAEEGNTALDLKLRSFEETMGDTAKKLLELEKWFGGK